MRRLFFPVSVSLSRSFLLSFSVAVSFSFSFPFPCPPSCSCSCTGRYCWGGGQVCIDKVEEDIAFCGLRRKDVALRVLAELRCAEHGSQRSARCNWYQRVFLSTEMQRRDRQQHCISLWRRWCSSSPLCCTHDAGLRRRRVRLFAVEVACVRVYDGVRCVYVVVYARARMHVRIGTNTNGMASALDK